MSGSFAGRYRVPPKACRNKWCACWVEICNQSFVN